MAEDVQLDRGAEPDRGDPGCGPRIAVLFERGRHGVAALEEASRLAASPECQVTVVVLAPQVSASRRCDLSPDAYNSAVVEAAMAELHEAASLLPASTAGTRFTLLLEGRDPPLTEWIAREGFDLVLLPARRRLTRSAGHPAARRLRRAGGCSVRVVSSPGR